MPMGRWPTNGQGFGSSLQLAIALEAGTGCLELAQKKVGETTPTQGIKVLTNR